MIKISIFQFIRAITTKDNSRKMKQCDKKSVYFRRLNLNRFLEFGTQIDRAIEVKRR